MIAKLWSSMVQRIGWIIDGYCARRLSRDKMLPDFSRIVSDPRRKEPTMPYLSPHWKTAPAEPSGDKTPQFAECPRCGIRHEDIVRIGQQCDRIRGAIAFGERRCDGKLIGMRTKGW